MGQRIDLHKRLLEIADNVYFQPPASFRLHYPCIVYERSEIATRHGNNFPYKYTKRYKITVISINPDDNMVDEIATLPMCSHDTFFTAENLNHDVFTIYF